jgi:hypothetical protein
VDVLHERCALDDGIDISKKDATACVRTPSTKRRGAFSTETTTWGSTTNAVLALRDHLLAAQVTLVVIEATSDRGQSQLAGEAERQSGPGNARGAGAASDNVRDGFELSDGRGLHRRVAEGSLTPRPSQIRT